MRKTSLALLAGIVALAAVPVEAQTTRHHRYDTRGSEAHRAARPAPRHVERAPVRQAPVVPITRWNTPNADGNFGGPGAGGAGPGA
ncbi:hypothetical protein EV668_1389 [Enterovirga rhinocerotis]|uniref:Uncharacterized protein n=1 Tax=Enterovirga rhinocerotis TaxID=1339210 RepID=A0A4R7CAR9_9HYPH|nr:hypothetical protein EV668_1389 [Enterovirga rhinocerotis]